MPRFVDLVLFGKESFGQNNCQNNHLVQRFTFWKSSCGDQEVDIPTMCPPAKAPSPSACELRYFREARYWVTGD